MATSTFAPTHTFGSDVRHAARWIVTFLLCVCIIIWSAIAAAQETPKEGNAVKDVAKQVLLDPTTYVPAAVVYTSMQLDWNTSQPLFQECGRADLAGDVLTRLCRFADGPPATGGLAPLAADEIPVGADEGVLFQILPLVGARLRAGCRCGRSAAPSRASDRRRSTA